MYVHFCFCFLFFICSFFFIKQINSALNLWKVKILRGSSLHLRPAIWELPSNYSTRFLFLSCLHTSFPWISCHCVLGAYIEAISIGYMTAYLLFHRNAGAWVFSKSFALNGLISYLLLYLFCQFIFYINYMVFLNNCKFFISVTSLSLGKYKLTYLLTDFLTSLLTY